VYTSESIESVKQRLHDMAGKVKITFLARSDTEGLLAVAEYSLHNILRTFEKEAKSEMTKDEPFLKTEPAGEATETQEPKSWYNRYDKSFQPTIILDDSLCWVAFGAFSKWCNLQNNLNLDTILGHELAHLAARSWRADLA
jgi:hypothetical protein